MQPIDYTIIIVYLVGMITVGLLLQKRASGGIDSYFLGNRDLPWWALGASGMASNLDITGTMINTAFIFALGISGFFIEIRGGVTLIMAFLMIFMGKWNRRAKVMTAAEWMHFRFGTGREGDIARLFSAISSIVITVAMITYFAVGSGKFVGTFLGLPDFGKVSNQLDASEIASIDQQINDLFVTNDSLLHKIQPLQKLSSAAKTQTNSLRKLNRKWQTVTQDVLNITALDEFEKQIDASVTQLKSLQRNYNEIVPTGAAGIAEPAGDDLADLNNQLELLDQSFSQYTEYSIIVTRAFLAATLMIILAMIYTVSSGLYGVVWTDVFQGFLIFGTIIVVCFIAFTKQLPDIFNISLPMRDGTFMAVETTKQAWTNVVPPWELGLPAESAYSIYNLFGIAILFYLIKVTIEGSGGTGGYMLQRYFAAKSDREAGLLSLFWTFLLSFRWPFIAAIAMLGVYFGMEQGVISDPEKVLPVVVNEMIPVGVKGFLVAGLMAAAMSTFDSTVNAGAAYWTKDIYQAYLKPKATGKQLMFQSRISSIGIVLLGLFFSLAIKNINEIWGWITMSIGAGMIIPQLVRWYWWRMNGYGFAAGIAAGMLTAVLQKMLLPDVAEYVAFSIVASSSLIALLIGTFVTEPTARKVLENFYLTTRPFGFWQPVRKAIPAKIISAVNTENRRDLIAVFMAVPWQVVLFLTWMTIMMQRWDQLWWLSVALILLSAGLYFKWFRHLSKEVKVDV